MSKKTDTYPHTVVKSLTIKIKFYELQCGRFGLLYEEKNSIQPIWTSLTPKGSKR